MKKLLTVPDVQRLLNCSRSMVYRLLEDHSIDGLLLRGSRRITTESIEAYVEAEIIRFKQQA